ncbi:sensor histidine kinase [Anaeromicropila populeti]|uniref:histidine kinase n=1 Tax=Anaeromicropila populeti TaxID=37658 RepID=A0A1I6LJ03_9FIRM|nr:HAMP domain-containing sensor histidine kinase [Anaeromicropila populeti]SFS03300.1 His Kinase A (phospho-acceptor) domain-containing protein [Anaeromicropila populeti]
MIGKVRWKFIWMSVSAMAVCTAVIIAAINLVNYYYLNSELEKVISETSLNQGELPEYWKNHVGRKNEKFQVAASQYENQYFSVWIYEDGDKQVVDLKHINNVTEEEAIDLANKALELNKEKGRIGNYKYAVFSENDNLKIVTIFNCESHFYNIYSLRWISVSIGLVGLLCVFLFVVLMSGKAVKPLIESDKKQKRFITDAGHELKTPLTVIATNMDILAMDIGNNEWVENTQKQVTTMRKLVNHLVSLSRMEEEEVVLDMQRFNLSHAVTDTTASFAAVAEFEGKTFCYEVEPDIFINGNEGAIRQLVAILCDNAIKYCVDEGDIRLNLRSKGKKAVLDISNRCDVEMDSKSMNCFFDRFYRADESRSRENGKTSYGLGLSIGKSIVEKHHGQISVQQREGGRIGFTVII